MAQLAHRPRRSRNDYARNERQPSRQECAADLSPEQQLAVEVIHLALLDARSNRYADARRFLADTPMFRFWAAVAQLDAELVLDRCRRRRRSR